MFIHNKIIGPDHEEYERASNFVAVYCNFDNCNNYTRVNEVFCPGEEAADDRLLQCTRDNLRRFPCHEWLKITRNISNFIINDFFFISLEEIYLYGNAN